MIVVMAVMEVLFDQSPGEAETEQTLDSNLQSDHGSAIIVVLYWTNMKGLQS